MKLWIRSQNKEALANVKNVRFCKMKKCELKETPCTIKEFMASTDAYCVECNGEIFGEYATRERCLEIIDEIQKILSRNGIMLFKNVDISEIPKVAFEPFKALSYLPYNDKNSEVTVHNAEVVVYEMPEE